jgi:signal transduction histidine kinase
LGYFFISIIAAVVFGVLSFYIIESSYSQAKLELNIEEKENAELFIDELNNRLEDLPSIEDLEYEIGYLLSSDGVYHINVVDEKGALLYSSSEDTQQQRDFILYRTFTIKGENNILFLEGKYKDRSYEEDILAMIIILISIILFVFIFFRLANRRINYIHEISESVDSISIGDHDSPIILSGNDELTFLADNINYMSRSIKEKKEHEIKIERSKKELITNMSHDLRTPLTSIIGYLSLIVDSNYEDENKLNEYANICYTKSQQLKKLINRLFEYSKLTSEKLKVEKVNLDINRFINQIRGEYSHIVEENNLKFEVNLTEIKPHISGDPLLMVRVFENLIYNAVKYAKKPGKLTIATSVKGDYVLIQVANTIDKKQFKKGDMENIFDRMFIKDKSRSGGKSSGLGLAISREIVEMNNGRIWAEISGGNIVFFMRFKKIA